VPRSPNEIDKICILFLCVKHPGCSLAKLLSAGTFVPCKCQSGETCSLQLRRSGMRTTLTSNACYWGEGVENSGNLGINPLENGPIECCLEDEKPEEIIPFKSLIWKKGILHKKTQVGATVAE